MCEKYTDLALEAREIAAEKGAFDGIIEHEKFCGGIKITVTEVCKGIGEKLCGKPAGIYTTAEIGGSWQNGSEHFEKAAKAIADELSALLPKDNDGCVLVAGLGNMDITPDSIGPRTVERIIVTRHIKKADNTLFNKLGFGSLAAIAPGVLGQTGIESAEIIKNVARGIKPSCIIVVDALASRRLSRLASTVQISDNGIKPGSGVKNTRNELSQKTLGYPVISIGVPTVVDAATLAYDLMEEAGGGYEEEKIKNLLSGTGKNLFVAPRDIDVVAGKVSALIAAAINLSVHKAMSPSEINEYLG